LGVEGKPTITDADILQHSTAIQVKYFSAMKNHIILKSAET